MIQQQPDVEPFNVGLQNAAINEAPAEGESPLPGIAMETYQAVMAALQARVTQTHV